MIFDFVGTFIVFENYVNLCLLKTQFSIAPDFPKMKGVSPRANPK